MVKVYGKPKIEEIRRVAQIILRELEVDRDRRNLERHKTAM